MTLTVTSSHRTESFLNVHTQIAFFVGRGADSSKVSAFQAPRAPRKCSRCIASRPPCALELRNHFSLRLEQSQKLKAGAASCRCKGSTDQRLKMSEKLQKCRDTGAEEAMLRTSSQLKHRLCCSLLALSSRHLGNGVCGRLQSGEEQQKQRGTPLWEREPPLRKRRRRTHTVHFHHCVVSKGRPRERGARWLLFRTHGSQR